MTNPMVVDLNFAGTTARQDNKCLGCGKLIDPDKEMCYFRMDQVAKPSIYEVYCYDCGLIQQKVDKEKGRKIEDEQ